MTGRRSLDEDDPGSAAAIAGVRSRSSEPRPMWETRRRAVDGRSAREICERCSGSPCRIRFPSPRHMRALLAHHGGA
jgi:hypothetical protein